MLSWMPVVILHPICIVRAALFADMCCALLIPDIQPIRYACLESRIARVLEKKKGEIANQGRQLDRKSFLSAHLASCQSYTNASAGAVSSSSVPNPSAIRHASVIGASHPCLDDDFHQPPTTCASCFVATGRSSNARSGQIWFPHGRDGCREGQMARGMRHAFEMGARRGASPCRPRARSPSPPPCLHLYCYCPSHLVPVFGLWPVTFGRPGDSRRPRS